MCFSLTNKHTLINIYLLHYVDHLPCKSRILNVLLPKIQLPIKLSPGLENQSMPIDNQSTPTETGSSPTENESLHIEKMSTTIKINPLL